LRLASGRLDADDLRQAKDIVAQANVAKHVLAVAATVEVGMGSVPVVSDAAPRTPMPVAAEPAPATPPKQRNDFKQQNTADLERSDLSANDWNDEVKQLTVEDPAFWVHTGGQQHTSHRSVEVDDAPWIRALKDGPPESRPVLERCMVSLLDSMVAQCNPQNFAADALEANEDLFTVDMFEALLPKVIDTAQLMFDRVVHDMKEGIIATEALDG